MGESNEFYPARYGAAAPDGRVQCRLCPRGCRLRDGQRGLCFVRRNTGGRLELSTYGRSSGFCIDPVEKKPLNHFYPGSSVLSFGTAGCNLTCSFCQNWGLSHARRMDGLTDTASPEQIARAARRAGCRSVAFTYNDPVVFAEYACDTADACHALGVQTVAVTAGYISPEVCVDFFSKMDAANVDLKAFSESFYRKLCGAHLAPVLETLRTIRRQTKTWLEITTLLIPGRNDSESELHALSEWVAGELGPDVPLHFSAFHPAHRLSEPAPTPARTLVRARDIARSKGLRYVYTGNVHDPAGQSTYCHGCGQVVIGRDGYKVGTWNLRDGVCRHCATPCAGRFDGEPGSWGSRRQPVQVEE